MNQLLLIDGSSMLVRAFFATSFGKTLRTTSSGVYTNAVFGFLNMTLAALEQFNPTHLLVAWDVSRDTFRRELYPDYKGTRGELPIEMLQQFDTTQNLLDSVGIHQCSNRRYEADDLLGTAARLGSSAEMKVNVLTGDRDALQLVSESVSVCIMRKGISEMDVYTPAYLQSTWGLTAEQIPDLKALMGDSSDNIPGVPGVGEKTAKKLLAQFSTLEQLYDNVHQVSGKLRQKLVDNRDLAFLSKELATIVCDAPMESSALDWRVQLNLDDVTTAFTELELHRSLGRWKEFIGATS
ncbi:5'-3' exonuclease H3TH domain-containing protein [Alicyclobacillus sp. SO9]|uniref:5'-3' exonuclease n=1 Tax=Alicyclobacillus sp. SO9 TaxID=2665646 RepID=UPI0018E8BBFF|nr:5'-3' exonuclease H3TH domain-containing protein [Alicyclobacillus sp. SO9]QQE79363.1 flap endonuclease [Alicyclobacillus sp. SO9]